MILMTLFLAIIAGGRNKAPKMKTMRSGRCACNPWCFDTHLECPLNSEVWNSFLILSCLSVLLPVAESHKMQALRELHNALTETKALFESSDARLYTPDVKDITKCTNKFIDCYLLEMSVLLHEDNTGDHNKSRNIFKIHTTLKEYSNYNCSAQHPCEALKLTNSMEFYNSMTTFLEKLIAICKDGDISTCD